METDTQQKATTAKHKMSETNAYIDLDFTKYWWGHFMWGAQAAVRTALSLVIRSQDEL